MISLDLLICFNIIFLLGETGQITVSGAISVSDDVFFFLKIIILLAQKNFLVRVIANFVGQ